MNRFAFIAAFCFLVLFSSCEKTYGIEIAPGGGTTISIEVGQTAYSPQEQCVIMEALQSRRQISEASVSNEVYSVKFTGNKTAHLRLDIFPLVTSDDNLLWKLNGVETGVPVHMNEDGGIVLPALTPKMGSWYLENYDSSVSSIPYSEYDASVTETHLVGLLEFQDRLFVYQSDGCIDSISIIKEGFYRVPDYWLDHLVEKERLVEAAIEEANGNCAVFAFFTDAHWGFNFKHSPALLRHITEYTPVSNVFFGGDVNTNHFNNTVTALQLGLDFQASYSFLGPHFYCVYGNHDNNSASQPSRTELHLTEEQVISYLQSQMTKLDKKVGYNFYFDDSATQTRYIGLDTGRYHNATFRTTSTETARFLIDSLTDVPEDWHIIIFSHIWAEYKAVDGVETSVFNSFYNSFINIIHDFNARKAGTFTFRKDSVEYDFTAVRAYVECCIGGHTHLNSTLMSRDVLPVIIVGKDSMKRNNYKAIEGTLKEQCVAVLVLDYNLRKIKLFFVGYGDDQIIGFPHYE